jgi:hypothetical protein
MNATCKFFAAFTATLLTAALVAFLTLMMQVYV